MRGSCNKICCLFFFFFFFFLLVRIPDGYPLICRLKIVQRRWRCGKKSVGVLTPPPPPPPPPSSAFWELRDYGLAAVSKKTLCPPPPLSPSDFRPCLLGAKLFIPLQFRTPVRTHCIQPIRDCAYSFAVQPIHCE